MDFRERWNQGELLMHLLVGGVKPIAAGGIIESEIPAPQGRGKGQGLCLFFGDPVQNPKPKFFQFIG